MAPTGYRAHVVLMVSSMEASAHCWSHRDGLESQQRRTVERTMPCAHHGSCDGRGRARRRAEATVDAHVMELSVPLLALGIILVVGEEQSPCRAEYVGWAPIIS